MNEPYRIVPRSATRRAGPVSPPRRVRPVLLVLAAALLMPGVLHAEKLVYTLEIPDKQRVAYEVPIRVLHAGRLSITASWPGNRVLAFKLEAPGSPPLRRSGPSPQRIEVIVNASGTGGAPWTLSIRGLAAGGGGAGNLIIELPQPPRQALPRAAPDTEIIQRKRVVHRLPTGAPQSWNRLLSATERLRRLLGDEPPRADACHWQQELLGFLDERLGRLAGELAVPTEASRGALREIVAAIRSVESVRISSDPILAGPVPTDRRQRETWLLLREDRMLLLEHELDRVLSDLERGHAPELSQGEWPQRMISCVMGCQRHFEQRVRLGEERATNLELTRSQWDRLLAAAEGLAALADVSRWDPARP